MDVLSVPLPRRIRRMGRTLVAALAAAAVTAGCGPAAVHGATRSGGAGGAIPAVGAENQYADVLAQVGGRYVHVTSVMSNPSTDPHTFEASPGVARTVAAARLVVQNGLGYDGFMDRIESAEPSPDRRVVDVQHLLHLPAGTPNPHLWYRPGTMPAVARAVARDLARLVPAHAAYFRARAARFAASLRPWRAALARFRHDHPATPVATTEPVGDYLLEALGTRDLTPWRMQADVMNGVDPSPQDIALEKRLLSRHEVKVFLYNQQVTDSLTASLLAAARHDGIPVVGLYETMPTPGFTYQSWMRAETSAIRRAVADHVSTVKL